MSILIIVVSAGDLELGVTIVIIASAGDLELGVTIELVVIDDVIIVLIGAPRAFKEFFFERIFKCVFKVCLKTF